MASNWNDNTHSEPHELAGHALSPSATTDGSNLLSLPTEIHQSILGKLDLQSLRACALICHLFAQLVQKIIFSSIYLTRPITLFTSLRIPSYIWNPMRFLQILSSSPHLAGYVKHLLVSDDARLQFYREELSWIRSDNALHQILPRLVNLEELSLEGNPRGTRLNFRKWGDDLRAGILERCSSERLVTIHLAHVKNVPLNLLVLAPRLETLILKKVLFVPEFNHYAVGGVFQGLQQYTTLKERSLPARLKYVSMMWMRCEEWRTFYPWLAFHLDLTHIKILELHINFKKAREEIVEEGLQAISNLLRGCSATLETLKFSIPELSTTTNLPNRPRPFELDIDSMPALRSLHLDCCIWNKHQYLAVSGSRRTSSVGQLPQTALRTLSSFVSRMLPPQNSVGEPDGSSSSNSPTRQLETLELFLTIGDFDVIGIKLWLESIGWQEFIRAVEALAGVGRMSLELEWEAMKTDTRPWESWEMMRFRSFMPRPGATSVSVIFSTSDETDDYVADLLREKVCQLQDKGIGLRIDFASY